MVSEERLGEQPKEVDFEDFAKALNSNPEREAGVLELLYNEGKESFERGVSTIQKSQDVAIELMKFDLLVGSIYAALLQFGANPLAGSGRTIFLLVPFGFLILSLMFFLLTYTKLGSYTISMSTSNLHQFLDDDLDEEEILETMSVVYFKWAEENLTNHYSSGRYFKYGLSTMFASLGAYFSIFIFL